MNITEDHWLEGATRKTIHGGSPMNVRRFLVQHFTAGASAESSIEFWRTPDAKGACAHVVIDRDGTIFQCRPFNRTCGHAGKSAWVDPNTGKRYEGLNSCSIGIELANAGDSANSDGTAFSSHKFKMPAGAILARHKNGGPETYWEVYPEAQLAACEAVSKALVARYKLDDLVGHDDIAPARKNDPGPAFPMTRIRLACGFTKPLAKL